MCQVGCPCLLLLQTKSSYGYSTLKYSNLNLSFQNTYFSKILGLYWYKTEIISKSEDNALVFLLENLLNLTNKIVAGYLSVDLIVPPTKSDNRFEK